MATGYPYGDLEETLGRPLTDDEVGQVLNAPGTPGGGANADWPVPGSPTTGSPSIGAAPMEGSWWKSPEQIAREQARDAAAAGSPLPLPDTLGSTSSVGTTPMDGSWWKSPEQIASEQARDAAAALVLPETLGSTPPITPFPGVPVGSVTTPAAAYPLSPEPVVTPPPVVDPPPAATTSSTTTEPTDMDPTSDLPDSLTPARGTTFTPPEWVPPPAYDAPDYTTMTEAELLSDPSYAWRLSQGQKALEASAAARGTLRTGGHLKDLTEYAQNMAAQEYAAAENRKQAAWDRNFQGSTAEYAPNLLGWQTKTANDWRGAELQFDRDWQSSIYDRDDAYRRMVFMADDDFRKAVYTTDDNFRKAVQAENDAWKRELMIEERQKWLAELGAAQ